MTQDRLDMKVQIAEMYYRQNMSQQEIAKAVNMSRTTVSRILKLCIDEGIVTIHIKNTSSYQYELERKLQEKYGLKYACVVNGQNDFEASTKMMGEALADYLKKIVDHNFRIGISAGTTVANMIYELQKIDDYNIDVYQMQGDASHQTSNCSSFLAIELARVLGGTPHAIHAPLLVHTKILRDLFMEEPFNKNHFQELEKLDVAIVGLGYLSMKNLRSSNNSMKRGVEKVKEVIAEIVENPEKKPDDKQTIMNLFTDISADSEYVRATADKMSWSNEKEKKSFIKECLFNINKSTEKANSALGGSGQDRNTFYSHVSDYKAFFYNYLIDSHNKQFQNLFFGITGATATAYLGELTVGAVKDVQVKKYNAETELNLQKRLVSTELRNFKSKKDSSIEPLCDEFYRQKQEGKPKDELKVVADNILNEIKNGAPYVYA